MTSEFLSDFLDDLDRDIAKDEGKELQERLQELQLDHEKLMKSVEGLCSGTDFTTPEGLYTDAGWYHRCAKEKGIMKEAMQISVEWNLDDFFCRVLVKQIPTRVSRALRLDPLVISEYPEGPVNTYLCEATRANLLGLFIASVALSRSALEQALEEKVPKLIQPEKEEKLKMLIKAAELSKLLQGDLLYLADQARKAANKVVHGKACDESGAFDILIKTREVVRSLYSSSQNPHAPRRSSQK